MQINQRSAALMEQRMEMLKENNLSVHEQLFHDAMRRRERREEYSTWCPADATFHPEINPPAPAPKNSCSQQTAMDFATRLYEDYMKQQAKREACLNERPRDPVTGQPFFQPQIGRAPSTFTRNKGDLPVGEYLYAMRHEFEDKKRYLEQVTTEQEAKARNQRAVSKRSEEILENLKQRRFQQIFDYLLDDGATEIDIVGKVLASGSRFVKLDVEVRADVECAALLVCKERAVLRGPVAPAFHDTNERQGLLMQAEREILDKAHAPVTVAAPDFKRLMRSVLQRRTGVSRTYLLPDPHVDDADEDLTFKPAINSKSTQLAARSRAGPAYTSLYKNAQQTKDKKEQLRRLRELQELSQCTFQPELISSKMVDSGKAVKLSRARSCKGSAVACSSQASASPVRSPAYADHDAGQGRGAADVLADLAAGYDSATRCADEDVERTLAATALARAAMAASFRVSSGSQSGQVSSEDATVAALQALIAS